MLIRKKSLVATKREKRSASICQVAINSKEKKKVLNKKRREGNSDKSIDRKMKTLCSKC